MCHIPSSHLCISSFGRAALHRACARRTISPSWENDSDSDCAFCELPRARARPRRACSPPSCASAPDQMPPSRPRLPQAPGTSYAGSQSASSAAAVGRDETWRVNVSLIFCDLQQACSAALSAATPLQAAENSRTRLLESSFMDRCCAWRRPAAAYQSSAAPATVQHGSAASERGGCACRAASAARWRRLMCPPRLLPHPPCRPSGRARSWCAPKPAQPQSALDPAAEPCAQAASSPLAPRWAIAYRHSGEAGG